MGEKEIEPNENPERKRMKNGGRKEKKEPQQAKSEKGGIEDFLAFTVS